MANERRRVDKFVIGAAAKSRRALIGGNICKKIGQNCPHRCSRLPMPIRVRERTELFSGERIFGGGIETRSSAGGTQFVFACGGGNF